MRRSIAARLLAKADDDGNNKNILVKMMDKSTG